MRVGAGCAEVGTAAGLAFFIAGNADAIAVVDELVGVASLDTARTKFKVAVSAFNADIASASTSLAFGVARLALSVNGEVVNWTLSDTDSVHCETV